MTTSINLQGETLKQELATQRDYPTYFYIDPNQFDGDDAASEYASRHHLVDVRFDVLGVAKMAADVLAKMVGHRVTVEQVTETSLLGREYETAYTALLDNPGILSR
ncbi:hypothetical protein RRU01S_04_01370 [Agrobacterium rubi TR3 = NBRC 13261]|uniref:Uncharacterized protein n=1 Tax=Agrobacterium rubi TR3 = NBRC 13261 TaxID=1368415 RepID=A0A081CRL9_9HYPH|nr:hypothetical protein [Agrobacterium rubi]MBP1876876.1 hypothetical protein [Agrobacterium rubi]MCL6651066.1 hypothetical protein [Agrobacterium rubi]GAK69315.1 hypothetical protein RRU01S_04_01370 [Agrobacterium rubi TR3 = NBRC 13261]